nr:unnamed protein product [Callosobruchus analis]
MTGLDIDKDQIMEIACLITDSDLNIVAEGPDIIINHTQCTLAQMEEWCTKQHAKVQFFISDREIADILRPLRAGFLTSR